MTEWASWSEDEYFVARSAYPRGIDAARALASMNGDYNLASYLREFGWPKRATLPMCSGDEGEHRPNEETGEDCPNCVETKVWRSEGYRVRSRA